MAGIILNRIGATTSYQFLLRDMMQHKKNCLSLYAVKRDEEFFETSVQKLMPVLMDQEKQFAVKSETDQLNRHWTQIAKTF